MQVASNFYYTLNLQKNTLKFTFTWPVNKLLMFNVSRIIAEYQRYNRTWGSLVLANISALKHRRQYFLVY
jgi:hypothetical protein